MLEVSLAKLTIGNLLSLATTGGGQLMAPQRRELVAGVLINIIRKVPNTPTTRNKEHTIINVTATAIQDGRWWTITVPEYGITGQAAHFKDAKAVAREITALWLDLDEADISATVTAD